MIRKINNADIKIISDSLAFFTGKMSFIDFELELIKYVIMQSIGDKIPIKKVVK